MILRQWTRDSRRDGTLRTKRSPMPSGRFKFFAVRLRAWVQNFKPMIETISRSRPKARKEHRCDYCNGTIQIGETYEWSTLINDDGNIYDWKNHPRCSEIAQQLNMYDYCDEGLTQDAFCELIEDEFLTLIQAETAYTVLSSGTKKPKFIDQLDYVCRKHLDNLKQKSTCLKSSKK